MGDQKNPILIAVATFSIVVMGFQFYNGMDEFSWLNLLLAFAVGGVAAAAAFFGMKAMNK